MFICGPCMRERGIGGSYLTPHFGMCEFCKKQAACDEVHHSLIPKEEEVLPRVTYAWVQHQLPGDKRKAFLQKNADKLFLTGSRFFDPENAPGRRADVDLYTQWTGKMAEETAAAGFRRIQAHYAGIDNPYVLGVYEDNIELITHHIILVKDVELYHKAQDAIKSFSAAFNKMDKDTRKKVYQACLKAADQP